MNEAHSNLVVSQNSQHTIAVCGFDVLFNSALKTRRRQLVMVTKTVATDVGIAVRPIFPIHSVQWGTFCPVETLYLSPPSYTREYTNRR